MVAARRIRWSLVLLLVAGCSKESLLRGALADPADRKETMELTLKICDEHPEYVDDLFALARGHAPTFDRLVQQTAAALEDPAFSTDVAGKLATHTKAVQIVTEALLATARNARLSFVSTESFFCAATAKS